MRGSLQRSPQSNAKIKGLIAGGVTGGLIATTGIETSIHEVLGHGYLGGELTHCYDPTDGPQWQIDAWDNAAAIGEASSFGEAIENLGRFIGGYDIHHDNARGKAWVRHGNPNELGDAMGENGTSAWTSLAGSVPSLALNTLTVLAGIKIKSTHPACGYALLTCGLIQHAGNSIYPLSAAFKNHADMITSASTGHDFANFSLEMANITGLTAQTVAITTAALWCGMLPAVAIALHLHLSSAKRKLVPDHLALQYWLSKSTINPARDKTFLSAYESYPRKKVLQKLARQLVHLESPQLGKHVSGPPTNRLFILRKTMLKEMQRFDRYLLDKIPAKQLRTAKREILRNWESLQATDKFRTRITYLTVGGLIVLTVSQIFALLGQTVASSLLPVATALSYVFPAMLILSIIASFYETSNDLRSSTDNVPKSAKTISILKTSTTVVGSLCITLGLFVPGLNFLLIPSVIATLLTTICFGIAKSSIINKSFLLHQSLEPVVWNYQYDSILAYHKKHGHSNVPKKKTSRFDSLNSWLKMQRTANNRDLLSPEQKEKLTSLGVFNDRPRKAWRKLAMSTMKRWQRRQPIIQRRSPALGHS